MTKVEQEAAGYQRGLREAMDVIQSEARWQWELDSRRSVGAQIVAQRMEVVWKVLHGFSDRAQEDAGVEVALGATDDVAGAQRACTAVCPDGSADDPCHAICLGGAVTPRCPTCNTVLLGPARDTCITCHRYIDTEGRS